LGIPVGILGTLGLGMFGTLALGARTPSVGTFGAGSLSCPVWPGRMARLCGSIILTISNPRG